MSQMIEKGVYRHNKSARLYEVIGKALHTETSEVVVIYKPLHKSEHELYARPITMFNEIVSINGQTMPRFEKVDKPRTFIV